MIEFINKNLEIENLYINNEGFNKIIEEYKDSIIENKDTLLELYKIDKEVSEKFINLDTIISLLDSYKNEKINKNKKQVIVASFYGNPYITINLCMQALLQNRGTIIAIKDVMLGTNTLLVKLFNDVLKSHKIGEMIYLKNNYLKNNLGIEELKNIEDRITYTYCIGNSNTFYKLYKSNVKNLKYIPFKNTALFVNNEKFEELKYELYKYCTKNSIEIEIYDDVDVFIDCVNVDKSLEMAIVISDSKKEINKCKQNIKNLKVFINKNPFKEENYKIIV